MMGQNWYLRARMGNILRRLPNHLALALNQALRCMRFGSHVGPYIDHLVGTKNISDLLHARAEHIPRHQWCTSCSRRMQCCTCMWCKKCELRGCKGLVIGIVDGLWAGRKSGCLREVLMEIWKDWIGMVSWWGDLGIWKGGS